MNGVKGDTLQANTRTGLTVALPIDRYNSVDTAAPVRRPEPVAISMPSASRGNIAGAMDFQDSAKTHGCDGEAWDRDDADADSNPTQYSHDICRIGKIRFLAPVVPMPLIGKQTKTEPPATCRPARVLVLRRLTLARCRQPIAIDRPSGFQPGCRLRAAPAAGRFRCIPVCTRSNRSENLQDGSPAAQERPPACSVRK